MMFFWQHKSTTPTPAFNSSLMSTVAPTNQTSEASVLAHKALAYVTGSTTGIIVGVIILIILIVLVACIVKKAVSGLKEAKERAMSKLKDLRKSREESINMAEAVPDVSVSKVQPLSTSRRKLENLGEISFSIRYDDYESDLVVKVHKAKDLPVKYTGGTVYKYVELELFPYHRMTSNKPKSGYLRNALDPEWEEDVRIKMTREEVGDQDMYIHVCDFNQISPRDLIGSYKVDFDDVKLKSDGKETEFAGSLTWIESIRGAERGDVCIILRYYKAGELLVTVKEIKGLRPHIGRSTTSSYVKVHIVHGSRELDEKKTKVKRKNFEPTFNERFKFIIPPDIINEINIIIRVKDSPYIGSKVLLGEVCIGGDAVGTYLHHWKLALEKEQDIEMWHALEMLNIVPGKTNLKTAMKNIPVYESSESEEEQSSESGMLDFIPDITNVFGGLGGLFGSSTADADKEKKREEDVETQGKEGEEEEKEKKGSISL